MCYSLKMCLIHPLEPKEMRRLLNYTQNKKSRVLFQVLGQKWSIFSAMFLKYDPSFFRTERGSEDSQHFTENDPVFRLLVPN